ncbi:MULTISPECIES: LytR C-terminal domain-containing protein [Streptomyces]|uniref:LytR C-terminal domain-containing protein n=1 Tax=Streptomyces lichenis TaxID=2306967 RepID=A0ABT0I532_9ACTN|nr:LytR C-terminal domain-containing protein [Streptomyces lichenis]MCK8676432.1 LytR C-terminal domain-containing protein [Streptomyces lichenis]
MSMLTPPGMGGKYRITGNTYPRMRRPRRRRRIVVAGLSAVVALGLAGWGTLQLVDVFGGDGETGGASTAAADRCEPRKATTATTVYAPLKPAQITVNVYNATPRAGLAKATADELKKRGFAIGKVGNAPAAYDKKVPGPGVLLGAANSDKAAFPVLATQLKGAARKTDTRQTADVDLIIGTAFKTLAPPRDATAALTALSQPKKPAPEKC